MRHHLPHAPTCRVKALTAADSVQDRVLDMGSMGADLEMRLAKQESARAYVQEPDPNKRADNRKAEADRRRKEGKRSERNKKPSYMARAQSIYSPASQPVVRPEAQQDKGEACTTRRRQRRGHARATATVASST